MGWIFYSNHIIFCIAVEVAKPIPAEIWILIFECCPPAEIIQYGWMRVCKLWLDALSPIAFRCFSNVLGNQQARDSITNDRLLDRIRSPLTSAYWQDFTDRLAFFCSPRIVRFVRTVKMRGLFGEWKPSPLQEVKYKAFIKLEALARRKADAVFSYSP